MEAAKRAGPAGLILPAKLMCVFGRASDSMACVEARARAAFPDNALIVWQGDPASFAFRHVGGDAEAMLGHPAQAWIDSPTFWVDHVVHPEDRGDAVGYCALATGKACDHIFEYRALHRDGSQRWLLDYVNVITGAGGMPVELRGLMLDISATKGASSRLHSLPPLRAPSPLALSGMRPAGDAGDL